MIDLLNRISYDGWLAIVGAFAAAACAIPGTFLMLRRLSLMGDAISHAVLPGLILAYMVSESRAGLPMLIGATLVGLFAAFATESLRRVANVDEGASIGIVFTALFAIGLVLINLYASRVDLDPNCVLNGNLELVPLQTIAGTNIPKPAVALFAVLLANAAIVALLYKELKLTSFDPALAATLGFRPALMHYLLMTMTALTCVLAFEAVGSILVVALLIVPAAAAHLLVDRLRATLLLAVAIGVGSALLGQYTATGVARLVGVRDVSITGTTATLTGVVLVLAVVFSPKHGVVIRAFHRRTLTDRIAREDVLGALSRADESIRDCTQPLATVRSHTTLSPRSFDRAIGALATAGLLRVSGGHVGLTDAGRQEALRVLRSHRLWETYLADVANVPADHTHDGAHRLEHLPALADAASAEMRDPTVDPHRKSIPPR